MWQYRRKAGRWAMGMCCLSLVVSVQAAELATGADSKPDTRLQPVDVTGEHIQSDYHSGSAVSVMGTDTPAMDAPVSVTAVPAKVLDDQAAQSLEDAVRNAPGVTVQQGEGNRDEFFIRGIKTKSDFFKNGMRDDTEYYRDLYNVKRIDVVQGPAALVFGRGGAGGAINVVTKKAERKRIRQLNIEAGAWNHQRMTLDVGDSLGAKGAWRLNVMQENSNGFRDDYFLHRYAVNPEFNLALGDMTQLEFGFSYLSDKRLTDRGIPSHNGRPANVPDDMFFGALKGNHYASHVQDFHAKLIHYFNTQWRWRNQFRVSENKRAYANVYPGGPVDATGKVALNAYSHPNKRISYINRSDVIGHFFTGSVEHKMLLGLEYGWQRGWDQEYTPTGQAGSKGFGSYPLSSFPVSMPAMGYLKRDNRATGQEIGAYVQDQLSFGDHWKLLAGIRWDHFDIDADYNKPGVTPDHTSDTDNTWSPRAGIIYKPVDNDSIYVSVSQTYTPQGSNVALSRKSPKGAGLDPAKSTNYEVGNKLDLLDGNLSFTAAVFQLDIRDQAIKKVGGTTLVNAGKMRNRGVELSLTGALATDWKVMANYTYMDARYIEATSKIAKNSRVGLVPYNQLSLWSTYAITDHWGLGAGITAEDMKFAKYANKVRLPGYVTGDAMAYYQAGQYRLQVNLNNVGNTHYYPTANGPNQIMPGEARNIMASFKLDF